MNVQVCTAVAEGIGEAAELFSADDVQNPRMDCRFCAAASHIGLAWLELSTNQESEHAWPIQAHAPRILRSTRFQEKDL